MKVVSVTIRAASSTLALPSWAASRISRPSGLHSTLVSVAVPMLAVRIVLGELRSITAIRPSSRACAISFRPD